MADADLGPATPAAPGACEPAAREQRFPCVGIALLYSAREDRGQPALGALLHRAATHDMSLQGLSFDVAAPLALGAVLTVLVGQPEGGACEQMLTTVRWCRPLAEGHFRVGVQIRDSQPLLRPLPGGEVDMFLSVQVGQPVPASVELACPACGTHTVFELVTTQPVAGRDGLMPLYDCSVCETTRSIMGLLSYARQTARQASPADAG